ncbi:XK-related protein 5a [Chanos chanos]|uniref:XK-related protein n=1 Tax=Chanos chanos TaxID=29144 RepID=A0A6J2VWM5_CHACN|nr:XK-related protein 5-like [Chanos chanos]
MINGGLSVAKMPVVSRRACWTACCQVLLLAASALVVLAERLALIWCIVFYVWNEQMLWAGLSVAMLLPGTVVQVLSYRWYRSDGEQRRCHLALTHVLHLGLFHRFWNCMALVWSTRGSSGEQVAVVMMRQAEVCALRLLEGFLLTLPQTLLQSYIFITTHAHLDSPVALCCGVCVLSLSWALVLFSRVCVLMRPGHVPIPPAALLCQLLWRAGMLSARVASLVFFARAYGYWVCAVTGLHWLLAVFWLASQRADVCVGQWCWRLSNGILGAVHVFVFLNVKEGPSRFRMAAFYAVMLLENAVLMLASSDVITEASWDSLTIPTTALCSFLMGLTCVVLYYRFLHPKSTEISLGVCRAAQSGSVCLDQAGSSFSLGDKSLPFPSQTSQSLSTIPASLPLPSSVGSQSLPGMPGCTDRLGGDCRHHHWLLVRLALKTGNPAKIHQAYGSGGMALMLREESDSALKDVAMGDVDISALGSKEDTLAPLSDCKEEFESVREDDDEEDESLAMVSPLESPASECKRSSPEGKSVFGDSPEPTFCPTESSSTTLYFSADPQSPGSTSNPRSDRDPVFSFGSGSGSGSGLETLAELSPISSEGGPHRGFLSRAEPRYTSTPRLDGQGLPEPSAPHLSGPRRQLVLSRRGVEEDRGF